MHTEAGRENSAMTRESPSRLERALGLGLFGCMLLSIFACMGGWIGTMALLGEVHRPGGLAPLLLFGLPFLGGLLTTVVWWLWVFPVVPLVRRVSLLPDGI